MTVLVCAAIGGTGGAVRLLDRLPHNDPRVGRLARARNAEVIRERKSGQVVRIVLRSHGDDSSWAPEHPRGDPRRMSHDHETHDNPVNVWKLRHLDARNARLYRAVQLDRIAPFRS